MGASSAFFGCSLVAWFLSNTLVVALSRHDESEFDVLSHLSTIESYKQSALDLLGTASSLDSQYTSCYVDAVDRYATSGCTQLSEDSMGRLALQLAECHLRESHRKIWSCKNDAALHKCTSRMSAEQFQVFSLFLTHTPGLCSLIRGNMQLLHVQESWTKLLEATMHAADWLKEQNFVAEKLLEVNNRLLSSHARLLDAEQRMSTSLELMETSVHAQKLFFDRQTERLQASVDEARRCALSFAATFRNVSQVLACVWFAVFAPVWINVVALALIHLPLSFWEGTQLLSSTLLLHFLSPSPLFSSRGVARALLYVTSLGRDAEHSFLSVRAMRYACLFGLLRGLYAACFGRASLQETLLSIDAKLQSLHIRFAVLEATVRGQARRARGDYSSETECARHDETIRSRRAAPKAEHTESRQALSCSSRRTQPMRRAKGICR